MKSRIERLLENALREQTISINHTAPMQAVNRPSRVREFVRKVKTALGTRYERVKAHVRQNKGKYALAGVVGLAGATMLHKAAKVESPRYAKFVNDHTAAFMQGASSRAHSAKLRLAPHLQSYVRDIKWFGKKLRPAVRTAAKYPRVSMLLGALAAERAHKAAYRNIDAYRKFSDRVGASVRSYVDDSEILQAAGSEFRDKIGGGIGRIAASKVLGQVKGAADSASEYASGVASGQHNPFAQYATDPERRPRKKRKKKK